MSCYTGPKRMTRPAGQERKRYEMKHTRYLRAGAGVVMMLLLGAMYAWSYFKVALESAYPTWSQSQVTLTFTIMMSCFCIGGLLAGSALGRLGKRWQTVLAAVLIGVGYWGVSLLPADGGAALVQLYVCYGVLNGLGTGVAYNAVLSGIQPWFPDCPGLISGCLLMGMGFGALLLGNAAAWLIGLTSLPVTFRIFAAVLAVILLAGSLVLRLPGQGDALPQGRQAGAAAGQDMTTGQMLRRPTFWIYFVWNICISAGGMLVINSASSITVYYGLAAVIGLLVSVFNGVGRLVIGSCMDRMGWKRTMYLNNGILLLSGALLLLGDRSQAGGVVLVGMLLMGICYGGGITISAALIRQLYGSRHYAANFSVCNLCLIPASILGPMLAAALQDASGGYGSTFLMVIVLGVATLVMNFFIRKP